MWCASGMNSLKKWNNRWEDKVTDHLPAAMHSQLQISSVNASISNVVSCLKKNLVTMLPVKILVLLQQNRQSGEWIQKRTCRNSQFILLPGYTSLMAYACTIQSTKGKTTYNKLHSWLSSTALCILYNSERHFLHVTLSLFFDATSKYNSFWSSTVSWPYYIWQYGPFNFKYCKQTTTEYSVTYWNLIQN